MIFGVEEVNFPLREDRTIKKNIKRRELLKAMDRADAALEFRVKTW